MKFIVTGSEGFIGTALCRRLEDGGADVVRVDRVLGSEADSVELLLAEGDVDCVYHLAAQTSVFNDDIEQIRHDNIDAFIRVADACARHKVKLVYASSSTAYAPNTTSMYGISKHFDEQYAAVYCPSATGCRLHNVYGPHPRSGTLLWHLMNDDVVTLYNGGSTVRRFTYIDDIIEGLLFARGCCRKLVNIVCPEQITTSQIAGLVLSHRAFEVRLVPYMREHDRVAQVVDESVFVVPLHYKTPEEGIRLIFGERRET